MIEIEDIWHQHDHGHVLKGFSAHLEKGKIYGLMGPNGAGKTSLMKILAGIYPLRQGNVIIEGKSLKQMSPRDRSQRIAYIPQINHVGFAYRVIDVVNMGRYPHQDEATALVQLALMQTELWELRFRSILELSGGELQRVFLARSLVQEARVLIMDEPFTFLDLRQQINISRLLRNYVSHNHTILISLHDVALALKICDEMILIREGRAFMQGSSSSVLQDHHLGELYNLTWD